jgi:Tol biopolymer transport system component
MRTLVWSIILIALTVTVGSAEAAFSGRNGKLAFVSDRSGNLDIWVVTPSGGGERQLTTAPAVDRQPAWSPDGRRIAFVSNRDGDFELYVMGANGSGQTRLTGDGADDIEPAWSPSGREIAFSSTRAGNQDVWIVRADGSEPRNLTAANPGVDQQPAWSPDGSRIVFSSLRPELVSDGCSSELFSVDPDGANLLRLTTDTACQFSPAWSPDGEHIAYVAEFEPNATMDELWVMNADGSGQTKLAEGIDPASDVSWSPDGTLLAVTVAADGDRDLALLAVEGTDVTRVTAGGFAELQADWQRAPEGPWHAAAERLEMPVLQPRATPGLRLDRVVPRAIDCPRTVEELDAYYNGARGRRLRIAEGRPYYCGDIGDAPVLERPVVRGKRAVLYDFCEGSGCRAATNTFLLTWRERGIQIVLISRGSSKATLFRLARGMRTVEEGAHSSGG